MADTVSRTERSEIMRRIKSRNTSLEVKVRSALHRSGLRFRLGYRLPRKPDIVFVRARVAVFLDSCFWHGCPKHLRVPKSNRGYWVSKIRRNVDRDAGTKVIYSRLGWKLLRFWEHDLTRNPDRCVARIKRVLEVRTNRSTATSRTADRIPADSISRRARVSRAEGTR